MNNKRLMVKIVGLSVALAVALTLIVISAVETFPDNTPVGSLANSKTTDAAGS